MERLSLTLLQADIAWQQPSANRELFDRLLDAAAPRPGGLVLLPEMWATGFTMNAASVAETMQGESVEWMRETAARLGATVAGSLVIRDGDRYFNRLIWMPPTGEPDHYDKRHLFRMAREQDHYCAGSERKIFRLGQWRVCPLICYDLRFPVWSRGIDEYDLLVYVANWPAARRSAWTTLLPARAVENLCYVAGLNRIGADGNNIDYVGDSGIWDYLGRELATAGDGAGHVGLELDGDALTAYRRKFPAHLDADRFRMD